MVTLEMIDDQSHPLRISDIDRLSEDELQALSARDLSEVRALLLESLQDDLKKLFVSDVKCSE